MERVSVAVFKSFSLPFWKVWNAEVLGVWLNGVDPRLLSSNWKFFFSPSGLIWNSKFGRISWIEKFKNRSDIERIIQSFFNEGFIIRTGSRVNSATSKLSAQVLQTVRHAFSMLLKFSHCTNFQDNARSCIQVILSHGLKSCVYIYIINCVANCDITFFLIFIKRKRNENFVCSLDWKAERKKDGKISDKKWKSLDRNWKRSAAVQMSFH